MRFVLGALTGCVLLIGTAISGEPPVSVRANPSVSMAPATVQLSVTVQPDARNRLLTVMTDSGQFYRSSEMPLDGENSSRVQVFTFKNLPAGEYLVSARVGRDDGSDRVAETQLMVTGF